MHERPVIIVSGFFLSTELECRVVGDNAITKGHCRDPPVSRGEKRVRRATALGEGSGVAASCQQLPSVPRRRAPLYL